LADVIFLFLLLLHVVFIVAWLGGGVLFVFIITPALATISPNSRAEVVIAVLPRYTRFLAFVSSGAVVAGVLLLIYISDAATSLAPSKTGTPFIGVGALLGLIALIVATAVVIPTANRLVGALKSASNKPELIGESGDLTTASVIPAIQRRLRAGAGAAVGLLTIVLILMVIGASV
jgi:hypothetical protein